MKILETLLVRLKPITKTCKICLNGYEDILNSCICPNCFNSLKAIYQEETIFGKNIMYIYEYDEIMRKLLYQFKGCYDYELKDAFLSRQKSYLKIKYLNYVLVPIPSWEEEDKHRGFNHVEEIFKCLRLPIIKCLRKKVPFKQSKLSKGERTKVEGKLQYQKVTNLAHKKVLIVDDVLTTGSTIKAAIKIIEKYNPKVIKVLVLARKCRKIT